MQTFLPLADFAASVQALDRQRLGKQRVEAIQILRTLQRKSKGWANHPAVRMWQGYEPALARYGLATCDEWLRRGYVDNCRAEFAAVPQDNHRAPRWLGDEDFHRSHQSNLVRKFPAHYGPMFPGVPDDLPYVWPPHVEFSTKEPQP